MSDLIVGELYLIRYDYVHCVIHCIWSPTDLSLGELSLTYICNIDQLIKQRSSNKKDTVKSFTLALFACILDGRRLNNF